AFQRADDRARIVVRTGDIQRLALLTEDDGARTGPRTQMPLGGSEVGVRAETQTARVLNRTKHHLAGQLDGRLQRIAVAPGEKAVDDPTQTKIVLAFRAEGVFPPQTVNVGEIAADRALAVPVLASDQHRDQAVGPRRRILVQRPAEEITNN